MIDSTAVKPLIVNGYTGMVEFQFKLSRRHLFLTINMLTPVIMLVMVGPNILLLLVESGERVSFIITVLLAFGVFLARIGDQMPEASNPMSYLSYYLMGCLIGSSCLTILTIFTTYVYYKDERQPVPKCVKAILNLLSLKVVTAICRRSNRNKVEAENVIEIDMYGNEVKCDRDNANVSPRDDKDITWKIVARRIDKIAFVYTWVGILTLIAFWIARYQLRGDN